MHHRSKILSTKSLFYIGVKKLDEIARTFRSSIFVVTASQLVILPPRIP